ncbi:hypothetical protein [Streptomyces humi]
MTQLRHLFYRPPTARTASRPPAAPERTSIPAAVVHQLVEVAW